MLFPIYNLIYLSTLIFQICFVDFSEEVLCIFMYLSIPMDFFFNLWRVLQTVLSSLYFTFNY